MRNSQIILPLIAIIIGFSAMYASAQNAMPLAKRGGIDIDGNNRAVLLVRADSGATLGGRLSNNVFQWTPIATPGNEARLLGVVDFSGSGKSDLAFLNIAMLNTAGQAEARVWRNFSSTANQFLRLVKPTWDVQAVGDLDGDGFGDLVWRFQGQSPNIDDQGVSYVWFTDGNGVTQVRKRGGAPLSWTLLGAADLNGDSAADMVYVSPTNAVRVLMATPQRTCANLSGGSIPAGYNALKFADFMGTGRGDILALNASTGEVILITLNANGLALPPYTGMADDQNASCTSSALTIPSVITTLPRSDPTWQFFASDDVDGDGRFDIVWRRQDDTLVVWQMNGTASPAVPAMPVVIDNAGKAPYRYPNNIAANGINRATDPCKMSSTPPTPETAGTRVLLQIKPSLAAACVTNFDEPHQVYRDPSIAAKGRLAVFLPGTGGMPSDFAAYLQRGSARGYHTIGLRYPNPESVTVICNQASGDASCAGNVREEILSGRDSSPLVNISLQDSIEQRLNALLRYLVAYRPDEGWDQFLNADGAVVWSKISVSGNSQGAGHAGYIGKTRQVFRVGMYSGSSDWVNATNTPPNWFSLTSMTPASSFFGYIHQPDMLANYTGNPAQVTDGWGNPTQFGMQGALVNVSTTPPPFLNSQRLVTTACATLSSLNQHNCTMFNGNQAVWDIVSYP
jgi:hypothetical protein